MKAGLRDRRADVEAQGLELLAVQRNKHFKFTVRAPDGRITTLTVSVSSSCQAARTRFRSDLKRFVEGRA
jgi:hypothetical protein